LINLQAFSFFDIELSGGKGIELEPNLVLSIENEDYLFLINDLLDTIETMGKFSQNKD